MSARKYQLGEIENALNGYAVVRADGYTGGGGGGTCASITFDTFPDVFQFFARLGENTAGIEGGENDPSLLMQELVGSACLDSKGLRLVIYFPGWTFV